MSVEDLDKGPIGHQVRKAEAAEVADISKTLAAAFEDDPVMSWLIPDAGRRPAVLKGFFELLLGRIWMRHEETYTTTATAGAAIWDPPGTWSVGAGEQIALLPRALRIWGRRLPGRSSPLPGSNRPIPRPAISTSPSSGSSPRARAADWARR